MPQEAEKLGTEKLRPSGKMIAPGIPLPDLRFIEEADLEELDLFKMPFDAVEKLDSFVGTIDRTLSRIDGLISRFDAKVTSPRAGVVQASKPKRGRSPVGSYSYEGQTPEDYCLECLERHYSKAHGLLEEAERFSLKKGRLTPEARERVRAAIKELVTAEEDLGTEIRDSELAKMLEEIKRQQRDLRKWMWTQRLSTTQEDVSKLREAIARAKSLVDLTYRAGERYHSELGECPTCVITFRGEKEKEERR
ncbi:MAG: hypothetical protein JRD89_00550 [Deltaproteobacteria bacterium]|nr:hypothetical protein [Deltaproteobacteria bacterium]